MSVGMNGCGIEVGVGIGRVEVGWGRVVGVEGEG